MDNKLKTYIFCIVSGLLAGLTWFQFSNVIENVDVYSVLWLFGYLSLFLGVLSWFYVLTESSRIVFWLNVVVSLEFSIILGMSLWQIPVLVVTFLAFYLLNRSIKANLGHGSTFSIQRVVYPSLNTFLVILFLLFSTQIYLKISLHPGMMVGEFGNFVNSKAEEASNYISDQLVGFTTPQDSSNLEAVDIESITDIGLSEQDMALFGKIIAEHPDLLTNMADANHTAELALPEFRLNSVVGYDLLATYLPAVISLLVFLSLLSFKFFVRLVIMFFVWFIFEVLRLTKIIVPKKMVYKGTVWAWKQ